MQTQIIRGIQVVFSDDAMIEVVENGQVVKTFTGNHTQPVYKQLQQTAVIYERQKAGEPLGGGCLISPGSAGESQVTGFVCGSNAKHFFKDRN